MEAALTLVKTGLSERQNRDCGGGIWAGEVRLYRGSSAVCCASPERAYACAGMDVTLAQFMLRNIYNRLISVSEATKLGVFVTALMKDYADGVLSHAPCKLPTRGWFSGKGAPARQDRKLGAS